MHADKVAANKHEAGLLKLLFGTRMAVDRRRYAIAGVSLMALKYAMDAGLIYATTGRTWLPTDYLSPFLGDRSQLYDGGQEWVLVVMIVWTLPFLWVGLTMSLRRAIDAGVSPTFALLFLVPWVNYVTMIVLVMLPTGPTPVPVPQALHPRGRLLAALYGVMLGAGLAVVATLFSTLVLGWYGPMLFVVTPVLIGASASWFYNLDADQGTTGSIGVALLATVLAGAAILLFAVEGAICLLMAMPIAGVLALIGGVIGQVMASSGRVPGSHVAALVLALPVLTAFEAGLPAPLVEREVVTHVIVDAPPAVVWNHVIAFGDLEAAPGWIYALGVAYPLRARIEGEGVGAVRHCEFTTGPFVEPITLWQPPERLGFDVASQPPPMHEWSPYRHVHPPHLDGYLQSRRGEFRLVDLGDGRTRLEGSTWYTLDLGPTAYWALWSDALMHGIHGRVLEHIKTLSERP